MHDNDYRERQISFVSGLSGTTLAELVFVLLPLPVGVWLLAEMRVGPGLLRAVRCTG